MAKLRCDLKGLLMFILSAIFCIPCLIEILFDVAGKGFSKMFFYAKRNLRPNALVTSEFGSHGFVRLRNARIKLHYVANGSTSKPLLLLVHGFPDFWYGWRHQLKEFSKDYRTVAFDMRGYGESDKPSSVGEYIMDNLVDDIDQLVTELGYTKFTLVGHDWGGAVVWNYAAVHPDRVERLIVVNCPHPTALENYVKTSISQFFRSRYIFFFQMPILPTLLLLSHDLDFLPTVFTGDSIGAKPGTFSAEDIEVYKYSFAGYGDLRGPVNIYRAVFSYFSPRAEEAIKRKISVPTLVVWGTKDPAFDKKLAELSGRYVDDFRLRYIDGASHWVHHEEPARFSAIVRQFLSQEL